jgi:hypothetical protein
MICGNRRNRAQRYRVGTQWVVAEHCGRGARVGGKCTASDRCPCRCAGCLGAERVGCQNEAEPSAERVPGLTPLGLCRACLDEYEALAPKVREHTAALEVREALPGLCAHGLRGGECGACVNVNAGRSGAR